MSSGSISLKAKDTGAKPGRTRFGTLTYVAPFVVFLALRWLPFNPASLAPLRVAAVSAAILLFSRHALRRPPVLLAGSAILGAAVFLIWIAPDLVWPHYRETAVFRNFVTGAALSSLPVALRSNAWFIMVRLIESVLLVPVLEELFWRGWLMRWMIRLDFESVPLGAYTPFSFWVVVLLFASEHGPYWDVGILAGAAYNWWIVRHGSLADCILAHAVTNALLAGFVLTANRWQYWL